MSADVTISGNWYWPNTKNPSPETTAALVVLKSALKSLLFAPDHNDPCYDLDLTIEFRVSA